MGILRGTLTIFNSHHRHVAPAFSKLQNLKLVAKLFKILVAERSPSCSSRRMPRSTYKWREFLYTIFTASGSQQADAYPSCCEPHYENEAKRKAFYRKIRFVCKSGMKTNFRNKRFALNLAFITRFKATRKWAIGCPD